MGYADGPVEIDGQVQQLPTQMLVTQLKRD